MEIRMWKAVAALAMAFALGGCANMNQVVNDVSTYSAWPADRKPGSYAFERLPSQQANAQQQQMLEDAAAPALQQAGFTPASDPARADVSVTLGARITATQISPYDDPFWWHGGLWAHRFHGRPFWRPGFAHPFSPWGPWGAWGPWGPWGYPRYASTTYEREVAILIRDRKTGQPVYEARAVNDGYSASMNALLSTMFQAAMTD
ncbi:MAG TPA: DUF4136 domain-containing protein, partial [Albitalea sp.]